MNQYLLDTTLLAAYLLGRTTAVRLVTPWMRERDAFTSIVAYGEVVEYIKGMSDYVRHHAALRRVMHVVIPLMLTYEIAERYADLRRAMRPPYGPGVIGDMDTLIAATALEYNLIVVTSDQHFQRVPGLQMLLIDRQRLRP